MEPWARRIKVLADAEGLNDSEIARIAGIKAPNSVTQWWGLVKGKPPTKEISSLPLVKLAKRLNTTAEYIMTGAHPGAGSQPLRLDGEMIQSAFREARSYAAQGGAETGDFNPSDNRDDAGILAIAINRLLAQISSDDGSSQKEVANE